MSIELPPLPFPLAALEPHMSKRTLEFHYGKHHKHYVEALNSLIEGTPLENESLEEIMEATHGEKPKIYNNAAQTWNHTFFWNCLSKPGTQPSVELESTIKKNFVSIDAFKHEFSQLAADHFGSGWTWLVKDKRGALKIRALGNAENPLRDDETPLLTCDVWEHAYYLDYQNERPKYLENFWKIVNWEALELNIDSETARMAPSNSSLGSKPQTNPHMRSRTGGFNVTKLRELRK